MARPFLTARWADLVLANYRAPAELLRPHVPTGSELECDPFFRNEQPCSGMEG